MELTPKAKAVAKATAFAFLGSEIITQFVTKVTKLLFFLILYPKV